MTHADGGATPEKLVALSLCLLLVACGVSRHSALGGIGVRDLGKYILVIERAPDGQVTHSWVPVKDFDLATHPSLALHHDIQERIMRVAFNRDCEEERDACERMCLAGMKGRAWSHMTMGSKKEHCRHICMQPYLDCCRLKELAEGQAVEFHAIDEAVDWAKRNSGKLLAGAVVVIAGVAFVVIVGGSGGAVLLLVPVITLASSDVTPEPRALAVKP
jgi:hypothetical protein